MSRDKTYIYGGTFDPPHQGHLELIKSLLKENSQIVIAPTAQNPFKENGATALAIRIEMLKAVLDASSISYTTDVNQRSVKKIYISDFPYTYSCDFVDWWRTFDNSKLYWAVATDIAEEVERWKRWGELSVEKFVVPITIDVSSSDIRSGKTPPLPEVLAIIKQHNLYFNR